ncbi:MAG: HutD family protein [Oscillospiraceae bacterium]|nr:HutD family protein [Oscillospiraceae bacterium]
MSVRVIRAAELKTTRWSGGKTTELLIFPPGSSYEARNFSVRVSSASVELVRSDFTALPGITRYIMPLSGNIRLEHTAGDGQILPGASLSPLDIYRFDGGWSTVSQGACTDFNLMLSEGWEGEMSALADKGEAACGAGQLLCLFALKPMVLTLAGGEYALSPGDAVVADGSEAVFITVKGKGAGLAAVAKAWRE